jgi:hypothetical protein
LCVSEVDWAHLFRYIAACRYSVYVWIYIFSPGCVCWYMKEGLFCYMGGDRRRKKNRFLPSFPPPLSSYLQVLFQLYPPSCAPIWKERHRREKNEKKRNSHCYVAMLYIINTVFHIYVCVQRGLGC